MSSSYERKLHDGWRLRLVEDTLVTGEVTCFAQVPESTEPVIDAQVPGEWPLDYQRLGLMEDPFFGDHYLKLHGYEQHHVFYSLTFTWDRPDLDRTFLRFEGIDTVADVYLNGRKIGHGENMFIPYEFTADGLRTGENELLVHLYPVTLEARQHHIGPHTSAMRYTFESLVMRKAAHSFGWDICPRIVCAGLWRPVSIVQKKAERIDDTFLHVERMRADGTAVCVLSYDVDIGRRPVAGYTVRLEGHCGESSFQAEQTLWFTHSRLAVDVRNPELWWPRGYGDANLYEVTVFLLYKGEVVDSRTWRQGLRTVKLLMDDYLPDDRPAEFCFLVNGKRIYVQGTNWVPADAFHSNDVNRIPKILDLVEDIGCNALRVWGGGVYEDDIFYDWCDEHGVMVWQDFMMGCGVYPQTERMRTQLEEEAMAIVRRLRRYACICLWAGDNECDAFTPQEIKTADNELTRIVLPRVLRCEDISRPYLPSSPYVSPASDAMGRRDQLPEQHLWGPRDYFKSKYYHDHRAAFASEMGYHGCNSPESIRKFIPEDKLWPPQDNDMWLYHAASPETENAPWTYRIALMSKQIACLFKQQPTNLDEYAHMSQISQAEAKKYFVESFRSRMWERTGLIWWNIMDCWPQFSDAVVDYYYCKKLAYSYIKRSQQPLCLMMDDYSGTLTLYGVNGKLVDERIRLTVTDVETGEQFAAMNAVLPAEKSMPLMPIPEDGKPRFWLIRWEDEQGNAGVNHYMQGQVPVDYHWYMECLEKAGLDCFEGF